MAQSSFISITEGLQEAIDRGAPSLRSINYEDECQIYEGQIPKKGRRTVRGKPLFVRQAYQLRRYSLLAVIST